MQARRAYERGLDLVNLYRGHPGVFFQALPEFQATQSAAYAYAGIAFTLVMASSYDGDDIHQHGFEEATKWLEKAQEWEPDRIEINFIEAVLYANLGQYENARLILDHLEALESQNYYLCVAEINYWRRQQHSVKWIQWIERTQKLADTRIRQAFTLNVLAGLYSSQGKYSQSIQAYRHMVRLNPEDALAWHDLSVMLVRMRQFKEAEACNQRALSIADFDAARNVQELIKKKRPGGLKRLIGR
jgi:tetratricopeptide (TPR) repeat protein